MEPLTFAAVLIIIVSAFVALLISILIRPLQEKFFTPKEYDITDENPWDDLLGEKEPKNKKNKKH